MFVCEFHSTCEYFFFFFWEGLGDWSLINSLSCKFYDISFSAK